MTGVVIVTGAFGALGGKVVEALLAEGRAVAAVDLTPAPGWSTAAHLHGGIDLADAPSVASAFGAIAERHGPIDGLVNVAGGFVWQTVADGNIEGWDRMYRTNLRTAAIACGSVLPHLSASASIVNISAAAIARPGVGMAAYAASKAGVVALTESLAEELRPRGCRVNAILPTIIDTPANRGDMPDADHSGWVSPESLARVVAFLLSRSSDCITGATIRAG